jgi:hypothetical protein
VTRQEDEDAFVARLRERWKKGAEEYGDASFEAPLLRTSEEMLQEIEDIAGWAFIAWCQLHRRLQRLVIAEKFCVTIGEIEDIRNAVAAARAAKQEAPPKP